MRCRLCGTELTSQAKQCSNCRAEVLHLPPQTGSIRQETIPSSLPPRSAVFPAQKSGQIVAHSNTFETSQPYRSDNSTTMNSVVNRETAADPSKHCFFTRKRVLIIGGILATLFILYVIFAVVFLPVLNVSKGQSGRPVDSDAKEIVTDIQTASAINPQTAAPTKQDHTFKVDQSIFLTFRLNSKKYDFNRHIGYVQAKFYDATSFVYKRTLVVTYNAPGGFFAIEYKKPTSASAEIYWCLKPDCSDEKLAQTTSFTIEAAQ